MKSPLLTRPVIIPALLLAYLIVMAALGWSNYRAGGISGALYFGGIAVTLACIWLLRLNLLRAARRRDSSRGNSDKQ